MSSASTVKSIRIAAGDNERLKALGQRGFDMNKIIRDAVHEKLEEMEDYLLVTERLKTTKGETISQAEVETRLKKMGL